MFVYKTLLAFLLICSTCSYAYTPRVYECEGVQAKAGDSCEKFAAVTECLKKACERTCLGVCVAKCWRTWESIFKSPHGRCDSKSVKRVRCAFDACTNCGWPKGEYVCVPPGETVTPDPDVVNCRPRTNVDGSPSCPIDV